MLKKEIKITEKRGIKYLLDEKGKPKKYESWLGGLLSSFYDLLMEKKIFPMLDADMKTHESFLFDELQQIHGKKVLELASGSGSAVNFLPSDNHYVGSDVSPGLLKQAIKKMNAAGFQSPEFYLVDANEIPFAENSFDYCLCVLSLNFFHDVNTLLSDIKKILISGGEMFCCVPVPERNRKNSSIRGKLYSEKEYSEMCEKCGLKFESLPIQNGAILYFKITNP